MTEFQLLADAIIAGDANKAKQHAQDALSAGLSAGDILTKGLVSGMNVVGVRFKGGEFFVPEVLIAARAMKEAMGVLKPVLAETGVKPIAKVAIGTVKGDLHDIGKNLVAMMLEGAGFEVMDLGVNVPPEQFVNVVNDDKVQVVALSALLTTTMPAITDVIDVISEAGIRDKVNIIIGGAPVTQHFADEIGADGYSPDAASAVELVKSLVGVAN